MRILYLSHRVPFPPNKGEKIHVFHSLKILAQSHDVYLVAFNTDRDDVRYQKDLLGFCKSVNIFTFPRILRRMKGLIGLAVGHSLTESYFYSSEIQMRIDQLLPQVDLTIAEGSGMASYLKSAKCPILLDFIDVDSEKWIQYAQYSKGVLKRLYQLEAARLRIFEKKVSLKANHVFLSTPQEVSLFKYQTGLKNVSSLINGVDHDYFHPPQEDRKLDIVFAGVMNYFPNVDGALFFYEKIWPLLRIKKFDIRWVLLGSNPSSKLKCLSQQNGIEITGTVEDIRPYLWRASVSVVPLRIARGLQNKILEAMAAGVPVVCTPQAFEGLSAVPGKHLFVEGRPEAFAERVLELLNDAELASNMRNAAYEYVKEHHDWERNLKVLLEVCDELCQKKKKA